MRGKQPCVVPVKGDLMNGRRNEVEMPDSEAPNVIFSSGFP